MKFNPPLQLLVSISRSFTSSKCDIMSEEFFDPISENHDWEKRHYEDILKKTKHNLR